MKYVVTLFALLFFGQHLSAQITYCTPAFYYSGTYGYSCTDNMIIGNPSHPFQIQGFGSTQLVDTNNCNTIGYLDETALGPTCTFVPGGSYAVTVGANVSGYNMSYQAWIDFNSNGIFETSESVGGDTLNNAVHDFIAFTIPSGVAPGAFRLRVEAQYGYHNYPFIPPCPDGTPSSSDYYGDARDYIISISDTCGLSIGGARALCFGSSITLYSSTPGGLWSSSNPAIATIDSTGVVTGVSAGVDTISYSLSASCGTLLATAVVTVQAPVTAAPIYGSSIVEIDSTIILTDSLAGGRWFTSSYLATVSSAGLVYGIIPGVATISYSVSNSCLVVDTTIFYVTIVPTGIVNGTIFFNDTPYYGNVKVWAIAFDSATLLLSAVDSQVVTCSGTSVNYSFLGLPTDSVRMKAATPAYLAGTTAEYVPTYNDSSFYWHDASVFWHPLGAIDTGKNIYMAHGTPVSGPGFIAGNVLTGADKGTSSGVPVVNLRILLLNSATNRLIAQTYTDASGNYSFGSLPIAASYTVFPDSLNYLTTPYVGISLTASADSMTTTSFKQHTISKTITPIPAAISSVASPIAAFGIFPNPASSFINIRWTSSSNETANVTICDMAGREMLKTSLEVEAGAGSRKITLPKLSAGPYLVSIRTENGSWIRIVEIQ